MVSVRVDDGPAGDLAAAIGTMMDSAGVEGRQPTLGEIEAACTRSLATRSRSTSRCYPVFSNPPMRWPQPKTWKSVPYILQSNHRSSNSLHGAFRDARGPRDAAQNPSWLKEKPLAN